MRTVASPLSPKHSHHPFQSLAALSHCPALSEGPDSGRTLLRGSWLDNSCLSHQVCVLGVREPGLVILHPHPYHSTAWVPRDSVRGTQASLEELWPAGHEIPEVACLICSSFSRLLISLFLGPTNSYLPLCTHSLRGIKNHLETEIGDE